jgi:hypothetical protein
LAFFYWPNERSGYQTLPELDRAMARHLGAIDMMRNVLILVALLAMVSPALSQGFYPISSVSSSTAATDLFPVSNLIQGPGVGFDANSPYNKLLGGAEGNWVTDACGFPCDYIATTGTPVLTFDLGQDQMLTEISAWGYASSNANGVSEFTLKFATAADGPGGIGTSITYNPTFTLTNDDTVRQSNAFGQAVTARYVELTTTDNFFVAPGDGTGGETPGGDRVGLGEVAFAVPEPSCLSLLTIGCLMLIGRRRR